MQSKPSRQQLSAPVVGRQAVLQHYIGTCYSVTLHRAIECDGSGMVVVAACGGHRRAHTLRGLLAALLLSHFTWFRTRRNKP